MDVDLKALKSLEAERNVSFDRLVSMIEHALLSAYHKTPYNAKDARAEVDLESGRVTIWARESDSEGNLVEEYNDTPEGFGYVASATARQIIKQSFREDDSEIFVDKAKEREGELVSAVIQQGRNKDVIDVTIGDTEAQLPPAEQVPGEHYAHNRRMRMVITGATRGVKGPIITVSRSHPNLVRRLFELEVPEISEGIVEINSISREAGHRSKIAVSAKDEDINPTGTCIGERGIRVRSVMDELNEEKIDIINYSQDSKEFIAAALSPAEVSSVEIIDDQEHRAKATVPQSQFSLAIGKEGQNARLAAKLTGWRIDIVGDEDEE